MATVVLKTARLTLRSLMPGDAPFIAQYIADPDVSRWLTSVPEPYHLADAEAFLAQMSGKAGVWGICGPELMGVVTLRPGLGLGYWLAKPHWRQGIMTEAVRAVLAHRFAQNDLPVISGYHPGNEASRGVLLSMGFRDTDVIEVSTVKAKGTQILQRMQLTAAGWRFAQNPRIETQRLVLRPMVAADAVAVAALANDADIARMLATVPHPFTADHALEWIGNNRWRGAPGFRWAVQSKDDPVIGMVAMGGDPVNTAYWLGRDHWGQGYATEAMAAFLRDLMPRLGLAEVTADAFVDNPASQAVLRKLGFQKTGEGLGNSKARLEPAPVFTYRKDAQTSGAVR